MSDITNIGSEITKKKKKKKNVGRESAYGESLSKTITEKLNQDNAPVHIVLSAKQFSEEKRITVLELPPYLQDLPHTISTCFLKAGWKYTRIYNPQRRLRVLVIKGRKEPSQDEGTNG
ncbi:hypothetical protein TNCV_3773811 [Trichonephila clavipes]|nr:hypothetical protein TNCV_3773811 [Trichonephila clavipes]